jgi:arginase
LRAAVLVERLGARDAGEADARIRDTRRDPATGVIGAADVRRATVDIAARVRNVIGARELPVVVGGDCTLLLGVFSALSPGAGLWFVDGHADFYDGASSPTGEAADMDLAILTGHGPPGLLAGDPRPPGRSARPRPGDRPLLDPAAAVLLGHRPAELDADVAFENARLDPAIHALTAPELRERGVGRAGEEAAATLAGRPAWLHLDLDVLDETALPAVSYPQPLGLDWDELDALVRPLVAAPGLVGVSVADFDPERDPDGAFAERIVDLLASLLAS